MMLWPAAGGRQDPPRLWAWLLPCSRQHCHCACSATAAGATCCDFLHTPLPHMRTQLLLDNLLQLRRAEGHHAAVCRVKRQETKTSTVDSPEVVGTPASWRGAACSTQPIACKGHLTPTGVVHNINLCSAQQLLADGHGAQCVHSAAACSRGQQSAALRLVQSTWRTGMPRRSLHVIAGPKAAHRLQRPSAQHHHLSRVPCKLTGIAHSVDVACIRAGGEAQASGVSTGSSLDNESQC